ncbi:enoyl-CoA hydratase/isomerase family protein [Streptomyces collinus]|uniref:enoyl-CoA hydratase/isomerase family protein n=1 Tax=Streptomyces collinus TaxID=42684 RepID=UPI0036BBA6E1
MTDGTAVRRETSGDVVVLTMNRPERHNVLDAEMTDALVSETTALARDDTVRAVVLTAAGRHFSLGGPLDEFDDVLGGDDDTVRAHWLRRTEALATLVENLYTMPCPVIAAVHGQAAGAGFSLALACDLRIASDRAKFNFGYGALGSSTDGGMSWLLPRVLSPAKAVELLLEQPVLRAARAQAEGVVTTVVPAADLHERALEVATGLTRSARHSVTAAKRLVHDSAFVTLTEHMRNEHRVFAEGMLTDDMRHALAARRQGELPTFGNATTGPRSR